MPIELIIEEESPALLSVEGDTDIEAHADSVVEVVTSDYEKLTNLPRLNGDTIIGDVAEIDPTVPDWAKNPAPPSTEDINAVNKDDVISFNAIDTMITAIFG